ncbi:MAG: aromatic amino acid transport family protein [Patescibacteria group bacterium]
MARFTKRNLANILAGQSYLGYVIGVGVFGIPYAFAQSGFFVGMAYLAFLGIVIVSLNLMYGEVVSGIPGRHRFVGYVKRILGNRFGYFAAALSLFSIWGALVAYTLVGGQFMFSLLSPTFGGDVFLYQMVFLIFGCFFGFGGLKIISEAEMLLVAALVLTMLLISARGAISVDVNNLLGFVPKNALLPYGVVMFALMGQGVIPQMKDILGRYKSDLRRILCFGTAIIVLLYAAFAFGVVGATGNATTPEAIVGLGYAFGSWIVILGALMGFLAVSTSFLLVFKELNESFEYDLGFTKLLGWFLTLAVPALILVSGVENFVHVISFTGAVFGGAIAALTVFMYIKVCAKTKATAGSLCSQVKTPVALLMIIVFVLGAILEVASIIANAI